MTFGSRVAKNLEVVAALECLVTEEVDLVEVGLWQIVEAKLQFARAQKRDAQLSSMTREGLPRRRCVLSARLIEPTRTHARTVLSQPCG